MWLPVCDDGWYCMFYRSHELTFTRGHWCLWRLLHALRVLLLTRCPWTVLCLSAGVTDLSSAACCYWSETWQTAHTTTETVLYVYTIIYSCYAKLIYCLLFNSFPLLLYCSHFSYTQTHTLFFILLYYWMKIVWCQYFSVFGVFCFNSHTFVQNLIHVVFIISADLNAILCFNESWISLCQFNSSLF